MFAGPDTALSGAVISANEASRLGGGVYVDSLVADGTEIIDNRAPGGGGLWMQNGLARLSNCTIARNVAEFGGGGAALDDEGALLYSVASDWGEGADDNVPFDVTCMGSAQGPYGADATFECDDDGCYPAAP